MCQNITRIGHRSVHSAHTSQCRTSKKAKFAFRCCCAKFKASPTWVPDITSGKSQPYQSKWSVISDGTLGTSQVLLECVCTDRAILPLKFEAQRESPSHNSEGLSCDVETVVFTAYCFLLLVRMRSDVATSFAGHVKKSCMCIAVHLVFLRVSCTPRSLSSCQCVCFLLSAHWFTYLDVSSLLVSFRDSKRSQL